MLEGFETSKAPFMVYYDEIYTYRDAFKCMKRINSALFPLNNKIIVLYGEKSFETYCGIFSIILSGNIWLPISPSQPDSRVLEIVKAVRPDMIITDRELPRTINEYINEYSVENFDLGALQKSEEKEFVFFVI